MTAVTTGLDARQVFPRFPRFPGFPGGCWEGPKSQHGKRGKMQLLVTKTCPRTGLEKSILNPLESVEKWSSW